MHELLFFPCFTVLRCPVVQVPANGYIQSGTCPSHYGASCSLACFSGYTLSDSSSNGKIMCDGDGTNTPSWTGNNLSCQGSCSFAGFTWSFQGILEGYNNILVLVCPRIEPLQSLPVMPVFTVGRASVTPVVKGNKKGALVYICLNMSMIHIHTHLFFFIWLLFPI